MFQFKRDFEEDFCEARDILHSRELNPKLQTFSGWLERSAAQIPLGYALAQRRCSSTNCVRSAMQRSCVLMECSSTPKIPSPKNSGADMTVSTPHFSA